MGVKRLLKKVIENAGYTLLKIPRDDSIYAQDGLYSYHNHDFMKDPAFCEAYRRGITATDSDCRWHWRVHVGLWAAYSASKLRGDFVECGVNRGFLSSAIMQYLNWDSLDKIFYLMDTFSGPDERYVTDEELNHTRQLSQTGIFETNLDIVQRNFAQWRNVRIVVGSIPDTLESVDITAIAYLHLDMNCALPEVTAFNHFWDRLVPGAIVLLDDYAYRGFGTQKVAMDKAAEAKDVKIVTLPTGQGLLLKP